MTLPSTDELHSVIVDILSGARDDGRLSQLTVRIVRQRLATHFNLEEDVLNGETYKSFIKATVHTTVSSLQSAPEERAEVSARTAVKKERTKSDGAVKTNPRKPRAKKAPQEAVPLSGGEVSLPKKASARSKSSKSDKSGKASKKPESEEKFKSKAIIESSDDEVASRSTHPPKERISPKSLPKQAQAPSSKKMNTKNSDIEMDSVDGPGPSSSSSMPQGAADTPNFPVSKTKESTRDPMESELSSVVGEPPKKRRKKQEGESVKSQKGEKMKRGKKEALSKDEETVNKLKGIVVACGVRKVWKKEFNGLDKPSQQIKQLHSILGDLGMTPRYSLEKAKAIRERRELAQELVDVQEFEKATKRRGKAPDSSSGTEESADQGDSDANAPVPKRQNARASIMAFLQDQSEEE